MKFEALNQYAKQTVDSRPGHQKQSDKIGLLFFMSRESTSRGRAGACPRRLIIAEIYGTVRAPSPTRLL